MEEGVECMVEVVKEREVHRGVVVVTQSEEDCTAVTALQEILHRTQSRG